MLGRLEHRPTHLHRTAGDYQSQIARGEAMKHTPGPWQTDIRNGSIAVYEASKDFNCLDIPHENFVAYWHGHLVDGTWAIREKDEANARLIAAAPELLEALKEISKTKGRFSRDHFQHCKNTIEDMKEVAIQAIAKAKE